MFYVTKDSHRYLENIEEREEGGTPNIVGAIRCGLVFRIQVCNLSVAWVKKKLLANFKKLK